MTTATQASVRSAILSAKPKSEIVTLFGQEIELRQPSMRIMLEAQTGGSSAEIAAKMLMGYAFIPGTDMKVFDPADVDAVSDLPWSDDLVRVQEAISRLTGIDKKTVAAAVKNSGSTQEE